MKSRTVRLPLLALLVVLIAGGAWLAWYTREQTLRYYTDADSIRQPDIAAQVRDVMWRPAEPVADAVNTDADEYEPQMSPDGTSLVFVRGRAADNADLYVSPRVAGGWGPPVALDAINQKSDEIGPVFAPDGRSLYFYSNRAGGHGGYDLWVAHRTEDGWSEPSNLGPDVNTKHHDYAPAISPDGRHLYFASDRPVREGEVNGGGYDLYVATLSDGIAANPRPLTAINTAANEGAPAVSLQGDFLYFACDRAGGYGGFDIYRSRRRDGTLETPVLLDDAVNSPFDELDPSISAGGFGLFFTSNRNHGAAPKAGPNDYNVYFALSREVFAETEAYRATVDWLALAKLVGPLLLYLLLVLITLLAMSKLSHKSKPLTILARCALASILVHAVVLLCMTAWHVTATLVGPPHKGGGTKVVLTTSSTSRDLSSQVRGRFTDVETRQMASAPTARRQVTLNDAPDTPETTVEVHRPGLETSQQFATEQTTDVAMADVQPTATADVEQFEPATELPVDLPAQPDRVHTTEVAVQSNAAPTRESRSVATSDAPLPGDHAILDPAVAVVTDRTDLSGHQASTDQLVEQTTAPEATAPAPTDATASATAQTTSTAKIARVKLPEAATRRQGDAEAGVVMTARAGSARSSHAVTPAGGGVETSDQNVRVEALRAEPVADATSMATPIVAESDVQVAKAHRPTEFVQPKLAVEVSLPTANQPAVARRGDPEPTAAPADVDPERSARTAMQLASAPTEAHIDVAIDAAVVDRADRSLFEIDAPALMPSLPQNAFASADTDDEIIVTPPPMSVMPHLEEAVASTPAPNPAEVDVPPIVPSSQRASLESISRSDENRPDDRPSTSFRQKRVERFGLLSLFDDDSLEFEPETRPEDLSSPDFEFERLSSSDLTTINMALPHRDAPPEMQYVQRTEAVRRTRIEEMGGSKDTEQAVKDALAWLSRHQSDDGRWDGRKFDQGCNECRGSANVEANIALTGLSLLTFLASDHTHMKDGPYRETVERGVQWLLSQQSPDGGMLGKESMYSHGIATIALAEGYGMTGDPRLVGPVQAASDFIFGARNRTFGGWRYKPGQIGDTSVLGWQVMALTSVRRSGLEVPEEAFDVAREWLRKVRDPSRAGLYSYQPSQIATPAMTAEAMFILQLLGANPDQLNMDNSAEYIASFVPSWKHNTTYFWYYATLALYQHGGAAWDRWNEQLKTELVSRQERTGDAAGSWPPEDKWATAGGRVYQTAICTLTLEVYYRYLPLYLTRAENPREPVTVPADRDRAVSVPTSR